MFCRFEDRNPSADYRQSWNYLPFSLTWNLAWKRLYFEYLLHSESRRRQLDCVFALLWTHSWLERRQLLKKNLQCVQFKPRFLGTHLRERVHPSYEQESFYKATKEEKRRKNASNVPRSWKNQITWRVNFTAHSEKLRTLEAFRRTAREIKGER